MKKVENLIVGLGIAGLDLCHQLEKAGRSFLVIDRCPANSSSMIAGGVYNPLALKRKLKSWMADELLPAMVQTHQELDSKLGLHTLHHDFPILKPISSKDEATEWRQVIAEDRLLPYVDAIDENIPKGPFAKDVFASVTIKKSGFVQIEEVLVAYREHLQKKGLLLEEGFEHAEVVLSEDAVCYRNIQADRLIFAEGWFISKNPFFNWIPFKPTKGQILTVKADPSLTPDRIYNQQFLLLPTQKEHIFKLGSTYEWDVLDEVPTEKATADLLERVEKALSVKLEVLEEKAAVRPTVMDRRPVMGPHPEHKRLFLFNGMGTKGLMIAPYFAHQLVQHIYNGTVIDPQVDLNRFVKRYYPS